MTVYAKGTFKEFDPRQDLTCLDQFKAVPFDARYPTDRRTFYSPIDRVHEVILACIKSAQRDILVAMYGLDDDDVTEVLLQKVKDEDVNVSLVLDQSQAGGKHETAILDEINKGAPKTEVVIGNSEHGAIMHLKEFLVDGILTVTGSTNLSNSGETRQDNQLTADLDPYVAIEASHRIQSIRLSMLSRQRLDRYLGVAP